MLLRVGLAALAASLMCGAASASVTIYTSESAYAAAVSIKHTATFEGLDVGRTFNVPIIQDGIKFQIAPIGVDLYVTGPGQTLTQNSHTFPTYALSAEGDEDFKIFLAAGDSFTAIGLDYITNRFGPPALSLFDTAGGLIGKFTVTIPAENTGFFGLISTTPIGYATSIVDRGIIEDTAIDNVRIGAALGAGGVPEPASWGLMLLGFGGLGVVMRSRRSRGALAA